MLAAVSLGLLAIVLWQASREIAHLASADQSLDRQPVAKAVLDWAPRLFATAPFVGVALGTWYSFLPNKRTLGDADERPGRAPADLRGRRRAAGGARHPGHAACAAALAVFVVITLFERIFLRIGPARQLTETKARKLSLINNWFLFPLVGVASMVAFALYPDILPQYFGVIPIFALWITIITVLACAGTRFHDVSGIPVITIAVLAVFLFQFAGWSDNHKFRHSETATVKRPALDEAFADWIASRKDAAAYAGKTYPVYIIAAQGGGIYAAYRTAKILTRLQDLCPNFAQHVFAISSVSGGSLGAGIFSALVQRKPGNVGAAGVRAGLRGRPRRARKRGPEAAVGRLPVPAGVVGPVPRLRAALHPGPDLLLGPRRDAGEELRDRMEDPRRRRQPVHEILLRAVRTRLDQVPQGGRRGPRALPQHHATWRPARRWC